MKTDTPTERREATESRREENREGGGAGVSPGAQASQEASASDTQRADGQEAPARSSLKLLQVMGSVLAAGLGVQSSRNRERDFEQGRAGTFIVAGLVFTALFIGGVYTVVSLVLAGR